MSRVQIRNIPYSVHQNGATQCKATAVPFAAATKLTCAGWINFDLFKLVNIIETSGWFYTTNGFDLYRALNGSVGLSIRDIDNAKYDQMTTDPVPNNTWIRFLFTIDITLATLQGKLYLNGVDAVTGRSAENQLVAGIATNDLYFGTASAGGIGSLQGGLIVDYILTGKAATPAEAAADYFAGQRPVGGTLLAEYAWNEGAGTTITDTGTGAKNITLTAGSTWTTNSPLKSRVQVATEQNHIKDSRRVDAASFTTDGTATVAPATGVDWKGNTSTFSRLTCAGGASQFVRTNGYFPGNKPGQKIFAARVKTVAGNTQLMRLGASTSIGYQEVTATPNWTQVSGVFTLPPGLGAISPSAILNGVANGALDIYVDDMQIVDGNVVPVAAKTTTGTAYDIGDLRIKDAQSQNLAGSSDDISAGIWTKVHATPTYDAAKVDPWGVSGMYKISDDATTNMHYVIHSPVSPFGTEAIYLEKDTKTFAVFSTNSDYLFAINLNTGELSSTQNAHLGGIEKVSAAPKGNGWIVTIVKSGEMTGTGGSSNFFVSLANDLNPATISYLGDGTGSIYIKRLQITGKGTNHIGPTQITTGSPVDTGNLRNIVAQGQQLLASPEDLTNGVWLKPNASITPNTDADPDGNMTLDRVTGTSINNVYVLQSFTGTLGKKYTYEAVVKIGTQTKVMLGDGQNSNAMFDLSAVTYTGSQGAFVPINPRIRSLGGGLFYIRMTLIPTTIRFLLYNGINDGSSNGTYISAGWFRVSEGDNVGAYLPGQTVPINNGNLRNLS